ncbi:MAG: SUF system Fe-S cluster assembly regulator [Legionellales bacterium]|nr:SUF system Fe-S cluster assembly regulator [Legionellales bacterium]
MLRISKLADYSSVIMAHLAKSKVRLTAKEISSSTKISYPTVTKLLKILSKAKFLSSAVGMNGGYQLSISADEVTLLDIVKSIDGDFHITECSKKTTNCVILESCKISNKWQSINLSIKEALNSVTLSDLLVDSNKQVSKSNLQM